LKPKGELNESMIGPPGKIEAVDLRLCGMTPGVLIDSHMYSPVGVEFSFLSIELF